MKRIAVLMAVSTCCLSIGLCRAADAGARASPVTARNVVLVLYAVQGATAASIFGDRTTAAGWHTKPTWYAVSRQDQTIAPDLERFLAHRMKATTVELDAGHLSLVSHPKEVADLILAAAGRR